MHTKCDAPTGDSTAATVQTESGDHPASQLGNSPSEQEEKEEKDLLEKTEGEDDEESDGSGREGSEQGSDGDSLL